MQAQILDLLGRLRRDTGMAIALITHDLGVIAGLADRVMVMYAGEVMERADVRPLFKSPQHPPTACCARCRGWTTHNPAADHRRPAAACSTCPTAAASATAAPMPSTAARSRSLLRNIAEGRAKACHLESL